MTDAAGSGQILRLPWVILGPRSQGRNYGVTFRTDGLRLARQVENCLDEFALALAAWADVAATGGAESLCCFFRLAEDGPWLLARARFMGRVGLGTVAAANAVIVPARWVEAGGLRWHALLTTIPEPAGRGWTPEPLEIDVARVARPRFERTPKAMALDRLAQTLQRHTLMVEAEGPESANEVLGRLLDSPHAPDPLAGWCDSGRLSRNGAFDPARAFDLIVHAPGEGPAYADPGRKNARVAGDSVPWSDIPESPAHQVWEALLDAARGQQTRLAARDGLEGLTWKREYAAMSAVDLVQMMVRAASSGLPDTQALDVLQAMALATAQLDDRPIIQEEARTGLALAFTDFLRDATPQVAAKLIEGYLAKLSPSLAGVANYMISAETLERGALRHLPPHSVLALSGHGLVTGLAAQTLAEIRARPLPPAPLAALLDGLTGVLGVSTPRSEESYQLAAAALRQAGGRLRSDSADDAVLWESFQVLFRRMLMDSADHAALILNPGTLLPAIAAPRRGRQWMAVIRELHRQMIRAMDEEADLESVVGGLHGALAAIERADGRDAA